MSTGNPSLRRMTLRQLLTHTEKSGRDLHEKIYIALLGELADFRELSRPVRRRSQYPKMVAVQNAFRKMTQVNDEVHALARQLEECLYEIREHAKREIVNRL